MRNPRTSILTLLKSALAARGFETVRYLGLAVVSVLTVRLFPFAKAYMDAIASTPIWIALISGIGLLTIGFAIAAYQFQKKLLKIKAESEIDELTGFKNHKALNAELARLEARRTEEDDPISLILLDIDNFKMLNEEHSYEVADKVLAMLGFVLRRDSRITDETYRYFLRGDEFLIVARKTNLENAKLAADRKRQLIQEAKISVNGIDFDIAVSCGITTFSAGERKENVLERLGNAIQKAKKTPGKNTTVVLIREEHASQKLFN